VLRCARDTQTEAVPADNILFASEMVGAVKGIGRRTASISMTPSVLSATRRT
jgi:hypothetical protein